MNGWLTRGKVFVSLAIILAIWTTVEATICSDMTREKAPGVCIRSGCKWKSGEK
jgi:hypothetical protein